MDEHDREKRIRLLERKLERSERNRAELEEQRSKGQLLYRRLHADLAAAQAQLVQAEKLASLGQLTAGIAHEIKNPLNFVNNFAEVNLELVHELADALREAGAYERVADLLEDLRVNSEAVQKHGRRADSIVRTMMQHASGGTGERVLTDLNALVSEHVDLAYHGRRAQASGFQVTILRDLADDAGSASLVPQSIGRVLLNLLGNAFDAVQEHASQAGADHVPEVRVSTRRLPGHVEIRVADNGPGMVDDVRERIFEPFFTTKPTGSGTGLGLSLSYDIVTNGHGGSLTVESEPGRGATFVMTLPAG
jgi:signal transduction histidine kinase